MVARFFDWLDTNPLRWHIANILQLTAILALIDSRDLIAFIGLTGLMGALVHSSIVGSTALEQQGDFHPYEVAQAFLPSGIALTIAAAGLWYALDGAWPILGLAVYALHLSLAVWRTHDLSTGAAKISAQPQDAMEAR